MKNRKTRSAMRRMLFTLALVLVVAVASVGGTIAWLTDKTAPVTNTFTVGDINITLTETGTTDNAKQYKIIPGTNLSKDPKVTVEAGSENCWLFVKVEEKNWPNTNNITYSIDTANWTQLGSTVTETTGEGATLKTIRTSIYYMDIDSAAKMGIAYSVLNNDQVVVSNALTKAEMNAIRSGDYAPSLTFKAYAIKKENITDVQDAWNKVKD